MMPKNGIGIATRAPREEEATTRGEIPAWTRDELRQGEQVNFAAYLAIMSKCLQANGLDLDDFILKRTTRSLMPRGSRHPLPAERHDQKLVFPHNYTYRSGPTLPLPQGDGRSADFTLLTPRQREQGFQPGPQKYPELRAPGILTNADHGPLPAGDEAVRSFRRRVGAALWGTDASS